MSIIKQLFLVCCFCLAADRLCAQNPAPVIDSLQNYATDDTQSLQEVELSDDSASVTTHSFDQEKLRDMRADSEMDYGKDSPAVVSLWDRIMNWLMSFISWLFYLGETTKWGNVIMGIIVVMVLIYVILRLLKIDALKMFYGKADKAVKPAFGVIEENIHEMDFEKLLQDALARQEYRLAIRLLFLQGLKLLADAHHIQWEPGKTNHDYLHELKSKDLKPGFRELNSYFEYAWYGNFSITPDLYGRVTSLYNHWKSNIR